MKEWLTFMAFMIGWALVGYLILSLNIVPPFVLGLVWCIGLVWLIGRFFGSTKDANYLLGIFLVIPGIALIAAALITVLEWAQ